MPRERESITHKFSIGMQEGYITAGKYEDGSVGEIFLTDIGKEGSTIKGLMNAFATAISIGLQYGVPLEDFVKKFSYMRFEPEGITRNPEIPFAKSMPDYIMRWLASRFIDDVDYLESLGIMTDEVRARKDAQQALPTERHQRRQRPSRTARATATAPTGHANGEAEAKAGGRRRAGKAEAKPADRGADRHAAGRPAKMEGLELGPACDQCGGMMQRTGSLLHLLELRQQHRLRLSRRARPTRWISLIGMLRVPGRAAVGGVGDLRAHPGAAGFIQLLTSPRLRAYAELDPALSHTEAAAPDALAAQDQLAGLRQDHHQGRRAAPLLAAQGAEAEGREAAVVIARPTGSSSPRSTVNSGELPSKLARERLPSGLLSQ